VHNILRVLQHWNFEGNTFDKGCFYKGCFRAGQYFASSSFGGWWGIMINKKDKSGAILIILVLLLFTTSGCFRDHVDTGSLNTAPLPDCGRIIATDAHTNNLMNTGYLVGYGNTTLFTLRNGDKVVYKIDEKNKTSKVIDEIQASQLLVNDQYVFIIDHEAYPDSSFGIYRFKPDGSKPQIVYQDDRQMFGVFCDDEWVYYCVHNIITCHADEPPPGEEPRMYEYHTLYKVKSDGKEVCEVLRHIDDFNLPYISDGWIYYSCNPPDWAVEQEKLAGMEKGLYKIKLDGTGKTKLLDTIPFSPLVKEGNWLFYSLDGLYRLNIDGSEKAKLCDDTAAAVNIKDQWIFYTSFDDNISLYRIDREGHNRQKMSLQERVQDISIVGEWVYFHVDKGDTWPLYRIKVDGTGEEKIEIGI
jgi:hypothetical protein